MEELDSNLDATIFEYSTSFYINQFKNLLRKMYNCYEYMLTNKIKIPKSNENKIRDIFLTYLKNTHIRQDICLIQNFRFDKEVDENQGRVDIKIVHLNDFENHEAYYIIECKRLDGKPNLNQKYISNGINRFTTKYYSSYYGVNGMIGFTIKAFSIEQNMKAISNYHNKKFSKDSSLLFQSIDTGKLYMSEHQNVILFHLMLNFSNNTK